MTFTVSQQIKFHIRDPNSSLLPQRKQFVTRWQSWDFLRKWSACLMTAKNGVCPTCSCISDNSSYPIDW